METNYLTYVNYIARRFKTAYPYLDFDELVSEGLVGVAIGLNTYSPLKNTKLDSWVTENIRYYILKYIRNKKDLIHIPYCKHQHFLHKSYEEFDSIAVDCEVNLTKIIVDEILEMYNKEIRLELKLFVSGLGPTEISKITHKSKQAVYQTIKRFRQKVKEALK